MRRRTKKEAAQPRTLNDGRQFEILKRYIDRADLEAWQQRHGVALSIDYFGEAFLAVSGTFIG
jgi:hypothetical protein